MQVNSLGLQMLGWAEVVVGARALLFFVPVMISKWQIRSFSPYALEDWFLWVATFASLLYFFIGIASIFRHTLWRVFHAAAMFVVALVTIGLWHLGSQAHVALSFFYFLPAVWAALVTAAVFLTKAGPQLS